MRKAGEKTKLTALIILIVLCAASEPCSAQSLSFTTIDFQGAVATRLNGINNSGQIVGAYVDSNNQTHGFRLVGGQKVTMDFPGAAQGAGNTGALGINNVGQVGQIVGSYQGADGTHGYLWTNGGFGPFDIPVATHAFNGGTTPSGINDSGGIVGSCECLNGTVQAFSSDSSASTYKLIIPNATFSYAFGINNAGLIVGQYEPTNGPVQAFLYNSSTGAISPLNGFQSPNGINNLGQIVGTDGTHGLLLVGNNLTTFDYPQASRTVANGINDAGQIVGSYQDAQGAVHGFLASAVLIDPVPDLLSGSVITTDATLLATQGRPVQGVAADGVAQAVIRIPAANVNDQITVTLFDDRGLSGSNINPNEDGALGTLGSTTFSQNQLTLTAQNTTSGPMAFGIYRAPLDFSRTTPAGSKLAVCNGVTDIDDNLACRSVSIQVQDVTAGSPSTTVPITIVRPPVVLIHGLWSSQADTWANFSPLYSSSGSDARFHVGFASYSYPVGNAIAASIPTYQGFIIAKARANSLGFQFNASWVSSQIDVVIRDLKSGKNPLGIPVAAVQADIVGHSMGGVITRTLVLQQGFLFLADPNYGQGTIHKLITVDTPHLGSPLAIDLLSTQNSCVATLFALGGLISFNAISLSSGAVYSGAIRDLQGNGTGATLSPALNALQQPGPHQVPTALIAGVATSSNYAGLSNLTSLGHDIVRICGNPGFGNPLAILLTPTGWPTEFGSQDSDAVVPLASETNNLNIPAASKFGSAGSTGYIHSPGFLKLGFTGPTIVDSGPVPTRVISLLNTPVNQPVFNLLNP